MIQRSRWVVPYCSGLVVWMVIMGIDKNQGWTNYDNGDEIIEKNEKFITSYAGEDLIHYNKTKPYRIVVEIKLFGKNKRYFIRGLYKYNEEKSHDNMQYFDRIK